MIKYLATLAGLALAGVFIVVFFIGRSESRQLHEIAPQVGLSHEALLAMGPRIASNSGATLGTARHVVYLLACSGLADQTTLETRATLASTLAKNQRLSDREAVVALLSQGAPAATTARLKGC